jgi:hypothetical protein
VAYELNSWDQQIQIAESQRHGENRSHELSACARAAGNLRMTRCQPPT